MANQIRLIDKKHQIDEGGNLKIWLDGETILLIPPSQLFAMCGLLIERTLRESNLPSQLVEAVAKNIDFSEPRKLKEVKRGVGLTEQQSRDLLDYLNTYVPKGGEIANVITEAEFKAVLGESKTCTELAKAIRSLGFKARTSRNTVSVTAIPSD